MATKPILMTDEDRERWKPTLLEYYRRKGKSEIDAEKTIESVFAEVQAGWNRAPNDLDTRIKVKTGFQWKSHGNLKPKQKEEEQKTENDVDTSEYSGEDGLKKALNKSEIDWWEKRKAEYLKDFEFNESSDKPLLHSLLVEELMQHRLHQLQLTYKDRDYSKRLTDGLRRVTDLQTKLGITREQRAGLMNKVDGNVAELSLELDKKLHEMPEEMRKEYEEELYYKSLKDQKEPINILPPIEKVEALLNVDGNTSANIDSSKIAEISEEVAKQIKDDREKKSEKPPKKELPEGMEI